MANFSLVSWAEISTRFLEQILMEKDPARAAVQPGLKILSRFEKPG